jgi:hypothetical protein
MLAEWVGVEELTRFILLGHSMVNLEQSFRVLLKCEVTFIFF